LEATNRKLISWFSVPALAVLLVVAGPTVVQIGSAADDAPEPDRVSALCLDCHDGYDATLALSPHRLASDALDGAEARVACSDCHIVDSRHYEDDPEEFPMPRPDMADAAGESRICSTCHRNSHQQTMDEANVHAVNDVNCSGCHKIHGSKAAGLLQAAQPELCISCHAGVEGEFNQPFRHPVNDGVMECSECHMTLDETSRELTLNGTNMCVRCHGEFQGPFPYEHQAALDYSTQEGGCLNCHAPHGSAQPRMLRQPYEAPHFQLCTQCHSVPPRHNQNQEHGSMWAGISCNECHTDIHGSYTNRKFLSQSLEGQGCLKSGCHQRTVSE
jgi:DmsE family decaheme c-type cytochrome